MRTELDPERLPLTILELFRIKQGEIVFKVGGVTVTITGSSMTVDTPGDTLVVQ